MAHSLPAILPRGHSLLEALRRVTAKADAMWKCAPQERQVRLAYESRNDLALLAPTGSGKSLCFTIPATLEIDLCTVFVVPTVALEQDLLSRCRDAGLVAVKFSQSVSGAHPPAILVVSVEQFVSNAFVTLMRPMSLTHKVRRIVFDEAQLLLSWGSFRPEFNYIGDGDAIVARSCCFMQPCRLTCSHS